MTHDVDFACASLSPSVLQSRRPEGGPVALRRNRPHPRAASNVPAGIFRARVATLGSSPTATLAAPPVPGLHIQALLETNSALNLVSEPVPIGIRG